MLKLWYSVQLHFEETRRVFLFRHFSASTLGVILVLKIKEFKTLRQLEVEPSSRIDVAHKG